MFMLPLAVALAAPVAALPTHADPPVLEIVIYTVKSPEAFVALQREAHGRLNGFDGFIAGRALRSVGQQNRFADVVLWRSLAAAQAAAELGMKQPEMKPFMEGIEQVEIFTHTRPAEGPSALPMPTPGESALEFHVGVAKDPDTYGRLQPEVHAWLRGLDPVREAWPLRAVEKPEMFVDMVGWRSPELAHATGKTMMSDSRFSAFFGASDKTLIFDLFRDSQ